MNQATLTDLTKRPISIILSYENDSLKNDSVRITIVCHVCLWDVTILLRQCLFVGRVSKLGE